MTKQQRLILIISILASFVAFLDASVVNVALPDIVRDLGGGLRAQQWVVDAYLITLGSLILLAGSLSDLFGRRRILIVGLLWFGVASVLCALAPTTLFLIVARLLQGMAGALLVPSSLALIISSFSGATQGKAIGTWTAWTGISFIVGPLVGGFLVDSVSWRLVFAINVLPIAVTFWLISKWEHKDEAKKKIPIDVIGAALCSLGLAATVYALIEQPYFDFENAIIWVPLLAGPLLLLCFVWWERRATHPMLPLELFKVRNFTVGNVATFAIYAGLSVATFLITVYVQQLGGYSALEAGLCLLPVTGLMFVLSPLFGKLASTHGSRLFMTVGPITCALGFLSLLRIDASFNYPIHILPGILVFGIGLSITVAPLTHAVLGSIDNRHAGIASAINNAIARIAGLLAIAAIAVIIGGAELTLGGLYRGIFAISTLLALGGIVSAFGIR